MDDRTPYKIERVRDLAGVRALLETCALPTDDIDADNDTEFYGIRAGRAWIGIIGLQRTDTLALVRSLAVSPDVRGRGLGALLLQYAQTAAAAGGVVDLYLLTTSARDYFVRQGFRVMGRDGAPAAIKNMAQFATICPASAWLLHKSLYSRAPAPV